MGAICVEKRCVSVVVVYLVEMGPRHNDGGPELTGRHVEESGRELRAALVGHAEAIAQRVVRTVRENI